MAKQLNLLATGQVIPTALHAEMQQSYLEYAMSVIVGRALPDVRDGLKPVHRRIAYAMHELGLTPDRPYRKCARVVGDVLGKYHPHGDQSVYDALVRMVQEFSSRYPLLAGHGNFGSVDNDPPAAMRYTETRLAPLSHEVLLSEIGEATVDFIGNFDNSQQEPTVLPAQLPILLLNGCSGIAVGMATNIPPHNLGEIVDGLIALIDRPDLPDEKLWELIPGPDFPTGGEILEMTGIREAYSTGRGSIPIRGVATIEDVPVVKGKHRRSAIVVTELPFQVNKSAWIEKIAELVNQGKIEGISDLRDESDRDGIRVVIELKRDINPQEILEQLYRQTALQTNFGAILLALVNGLPRQLTIREILQEFLNFREQTLTRLYSYELAQAERRIHIVEGLLLALNQLDGIIEVLRTAPDGTTAKTRFQERFNFSDRQADAILAMPLRRLTGLERQHLQEEFNQLSEQIAKWRVLLGDRTELLKVLKKDLRSLKRKYNDPRRTRLVKVKATREKTKSVPTEAKVAEPTERRPEKVKPSVSPAEPLILTPPPVEEEVIVEFTHKGYARRFSKAKNPQAKTKANNGKSHEDLVLKTADTTTNSEVVIFVGSGKAYPLKVADIPPTPATSKGTPLITLLPNSVQEAAENIVAQFWLPENLDQADLILLTQLGKIKRLPLLELTSLTNRGLTLVKCKEDERLQYALLGKKRQQLVLATSGGRLLRFEINDLQLPVMGRAAQGLPALPLGGKQHLVGCAILQPDDSLLLVSQFGYAKRLSVNSMRLGNRGDLGTQAMRFNHKVDILAGMIAVAENSEIALLTSSQRLLRLPAEAVDFGSKDSIGDRLPQLHSDETVLSLL